MPRYTSGFRSCSGSIRISAALTTSIDQRGVIHVHAYDSAGRLSNDRAVYLGASGIVDNSVLRIETIYDDVGRVEKVTSYADTAGNTPVNQVEYVYNGWGNVYREYQEHSGTVDANTPFVQYDYADGGSGGVAKYVRLEKVTYPDGREVNYDYGTAGAIDDIMSRLASIKDDDDSTVLASYKYLGAGRIVTEDYEEIEVNLDYNANDNLGGLDRFGRVADQVWNDYGASAVLDRYTYTYDRMDNRTSRDNELHAAFDEDYIYDGLYRLTDADRADGFDQSWDLLDSLGNWADFDDDGTSQTRTANEANEITAITGGWITPAYDAAGNMKSGPKPGDETTRVHYIYDAWNRLTEVRADDSGEPGALIAEYSYDGLNRRIEKEITAGAVDTHYYYNDDWQMLEERQVNGQGATVESNDYVWSARYIDSPIVRFHDDNGDGDLLDAGDTTRYYTTDANHNVTAVIDAATGAVATYYTYTPYGQPTAHDPNWSNPATPNEDAPLYCGYFFDAESELYQVRNRYYDSSMGAFVSRDPIGYEGGMNLYEYTGGKPTLATDSHGLDVYVETYGGSSNCGEGTSDCCCSPCNAYHQRICVDTWDANGNKTGRRCFSFRKAGWQFPIPSLTWFGHDSFQCCTLYGEVYEDDCQEPYTVNEQKKTTPAEDRRVLDRMETLLKDHPYEGYSVGRHNCRAFAQWEFDDVIGTDVDLENQ